MLCLLQRRRIILTAAAYYSAGVLLIFGGGRCALTEGFVVQPWASSSLLSQVPSASTATTTATTATTASTSPSRVRVVAVAMANIYDAWRSDGVIIGGADDTTMHLCAENVQRCLDEFIESDYGQQMFGRHELPSSYGITGELSLVEVAGPEVVLQLDGAFWHRRETVLGRAALWLHARMPEIAHVTVADREQLQDLEEMVDEFTGEVLFTRDKRAPDFNGDRETMEYQGIDPDVRGPFPPGIGGLRPGGSMINPA